MTSGSTTLVAMMPLDDDPNADSVAVARAHNRNPLAIQRGQCISTVRATGARCTNRPIAGGAVCRQHGGSNPHVIAAAKLRLYALVDPAITVLADVMQHAEKDSDRTRAAVAVIDRAGLGPRAEPDDNATRDLLLARITTITEHPDNEVPALAEIVSDVPYSPTAPRTATLAEFWADESAFWDVESDVER